MVGVVGCNCAVEGVVKLAGFPVPPWAYPVEGFVWFLVSGYFVGGSYLFPLLERVFPRLVALIPWLSLSVLFILYSKK